MAMLYLAMTEEDKRKNSHRLLFVSVQALKDSKNWKKKKNHQTKMHQKHKNNNLGYGA